MFFLSLEKGCADKVLCTFVVEPLFSSSGTPCPPLILRIWEKADEKGFGKDFAECEH